jgi:hypothetical protein
MLNGKVRGLCTPRALDVGKKRGRDELGLFIRSQADDSKLDDRV